LINLILYQSIEATRQTCILKKDEFFYFDILKCEVFDDERRLGFANAYYGHPTYRLTPEQNLIVLSHYLECLRIQRIIAQCMAVF
ncbi:nickel-dependent hydrogenase large subunit, partial [Campylobacter coli]